MCDQDNQHEHSHDHTHGANMWNLKAVLSMAISLVLLLLAIVLPIANVWKIGFYVVSYAVVGWEVLWQATKNIMHGKVFDENFLMAIATIGAFAIGEYPEAVAVMLLYQLGEYLAGLATSKSRKSISELMEIRPQEATVIREQKEYVVKPQEVMVGEKIRVRAGEKIPLDGVIVEGQTSIDTAALTGESVPRDCGVSDNVLSGAVNGSGMIVVRVTSIYEEGTVSKILHMVEHASARKAVTEKFISRFARYYTPVVVISAVLLTVIPTLLGGEFTEWLRRSLVFLVVSCPCALVISVPLSFFGGIGGASRRGILLKGANYLEALAKVKTVVFDKTGTITKGQFEVRAIHPSEMSEAGLLDIAALAESYSHHPIAQSIVRAHQGHIDRERMGEVQEYPGLGVRAVIDGKKVFVGNAKWMEQQGVEWVACDHPGTVLHIAQEGEYEGHIVIGDEIKQEAKDAVRLLKSLGVERIVMLTGDTKHIADEIAREVGIDEVRSGLLPHQKVLELEDLLAQTESKGRLVFVGDGINDAPVLTRADVGIAMGGLGSDAAIEAADVVIMDDNLTKIPSAIQLSRLTMSIVYQNIVVSLGIKAVVLAAGALGYANLWIAVFADVGVMLLATVNALRALGKSPTGERKES